MARGRELETTIRISGELDASLRNAIERAGGRITELSEAARSAMGPAGELAERIQNQSAALKAAQRQYASYVLQGEESSRQARETAEQIQRLSRDLNDNRSALNAAERAAQELADSLDDTEDSTGTLSNSLDDVGDTARNTQGGFTVMKGAIANLISGGIMKLIGACGNAITSIYGLSESTQEYREDIGKLETAWESAGKSTELATETYKNFYSFLGEEDRSVEAVNHLAKFVDTQQDMIKWTDIATGVWGTFGDSLPIEGLTEASNETAKVGKVTGVLADALNWAGVHEDEFQESLDRCNSEQERAELITETLNDLYSEAADHYQENNASIIAARKANSDYTDSLAEMGERIEPVTTAVKIGLTGLLDKALELVSGVDIEGFTDTVSSGFNSVEKAIDKTVDAVRWVQEHMEALLPILSGLTGAFIGYKAVSLGVAAAEAVKAAVLATGAASVTATTIATWAATAATQALASAIAVLTSPVLIAAVAIGALVAAGVWLYRNWDMVKKKAEELGVKISQIWSNIQHAVDTAISAIAGKFPLLGAYLQGFWQNIQAAFENVKAIFSNVIGFIDNVFSGNWRAAWQNIVNIFGNIFGLIGNVAKAPINGVISLVNTAINGINSIGLDIPEWVPGIGGEKFAVNIPNIPMLAAGGFTTGLSIAGEAGTEAVISFDPAYRSQNLSYWAQAGRMLGADDSFRLSDFNSGGTNIVDLGGVQFSPAITVQGNADKQDVIEAIEEAFPDFIDLLDQYFAGKGRKVYG